jgi:hypothetical protein
VRLGLLNLLEIDVVGVLKETNAKAKKTLPPLYRNLAAECDMKSGSSTLARKHFLFNSPHFRGHHYIVYCFLIHVKASGRQEPMF